MHREAIFHDYILQSVICILWLMICI